MNIALKAYSILSSCGFQVICSKLDPEMAKKTLFLDPFERFIALRFASVYKWLTTAAHYHKG